MSSRDMLCTAPCQSMWDSRRRYFFEAALRIEVVREYQVRPRSRLLWLWKFETRPPDSFSSDCRARRVRPACHKS